MLFLFVNCRREHKKYQQHWEKSRAEPDKCVCLIVDGMDQAKTNLLNTWVITKSTSNLWHPRTHVSGVLLHTKASCGKLAHAFVDSLQWAHDRNLTLSLLVKVLIDCSRSHLLPETLYSNGQYQSRELKISMSFPSDPFWWNSESSKRYKPYKINVWKCAISVL